MPAQCVYHPSHLACAIAAALLSGHLAAATIEVTNAADSGVGSLRWAVETANTNADPDNEIIFSTTTNGTAIILSSPLTVTKSLEIVGNGPPQTIIQGDGSTGLLSASFLVDALTVSGLTLTGGYNTSGGGAIDSGAAELHVINTHILGNTSTTQGGGIRHTPVVENGRLNLEDCTISGNAVVGTQDFNRGGGVHAELWREGERVDINYCTINDNQAEHGGGLSVLLPLTAFEPDQRTWINYSTISGNTAGGNGGGILVDAYNPHVLRIFTSTIESNTAGGFGGGIDARSTTLINFSLIHNNTAHNAGGGARLVLDGYLPIDRWVINNSTISGNRVNNITVNRGAGLLFDSLPGTEPPFEFDIVQSTIAFNFSLGAFTVSEGHGIYNNTPWTAMLENTIVAENLRGTNPRDLVGNFEAGWSLLGHISSGSLGTVAPVTLSAVAGLEPLADNGGLTRTHQLSADSLARNAGDPGFTGPPDVDQRFDGSLPRIQFGRIDIGALESEIDVIFGNQFRSFELP